MIKTQYFGEVHKTDYTCDFSTKSSLRSKLR